MSDKDLNQLLRANPDLKVIGGTGEPAPAGELVRQPALKFGNKITERDGYKFRSKGEAVRYRDLRLRLKAGDITALSLQVRFLLPGGVEYVADFTYWDLRFTPAVYVVEDFKGKRTREYINKRKQVEERYPFKITEVDYGSD